MPLHDHFHPPVLKMRHWSEMHGQWPAEIVRTLNISLPEGFHSGPRVYLGSSFEVDISVSREEWIGDDDYSNATTDSAAALVTIPKPLTQVVDLTGPDEYEVRIYDDSYDRTLVAAIEIISPSNKDRPDTRMKFNSKVAALLREGVCVSIVDIITTPQANVYSDLMALIDLPDPRVGESTSHLCAATLRKRTVAQGKTVLDSWYFPLAIGEQLPTIPIWISPKQRITLDLEASYQEVWKALRLPM
jgi:Protein of unknown function (DUF4058)